ncbi:hypothetical protein GCM10027188_29740 [Lysobacter humi (ex Lee et al. 2017)]
MRGAHWFLGAVVIVGLVQLLQAARLFAAANHLGTPAWHRCWDVVRNSTGQPPSLKLAEACTALHTQLAALAEANFRSAAWQASLGLFLLLWGVVFSLWLRRKLPPKQFVQADAASRRGLTQVLGAMPINEALVRKLGASCAIALAVFLGCLVVANSVFDHVLAVGLAYGAAAVLAVCSLWLWVYWLAYFRRTGQTQEFWLCYCLPYIYMAYRTVDIFRRGARDGA